METIVDNIGTIIKIVIWVLGGILLIILIVSVYKLITVLNNIQKLIIEDIKPILFEVKDTIFQTKNVLSNIKKSTAKIKGISWLFSERLWKFISMGIKTIKGISKIVKFFRRRKKKS
jgi:predicted rRNA methylase YqxC with S4 and FtsJ domains